MEISKMGTANAIRHEIDHAGNLLTGEDAIEFLLKTWGWDKAKEFSAIHNTIVSGYVPANSIRYRTGKVTKSPLYDKNDLAGWAKRTK